ncbi:MAG: IS21-like element helper ATPase IstB [Actinobacteria bacterium]|nr:IS21-like element helper ATPase IstB [Actinomycetota bacterium]
MKNAGKKDLIKDIIKYSIELRLPAIRKYLEDDLEDATKNNLSYEKFLHSLLEKEYDARIENGKLNRIRIAGFPFKKYLEDLKVEELPKDAQAKLGILKTLDFIKNGQNVILAGSPGTGKTTIAIGLGIKACLAGYRVFFTTVPLLINQLKEARGQSVLRSFELRFEKYDLVIADELGYISFDKEGSELLFTNLSLRAGRKSTIITTNLSFERWDEIFLDPVITAAMIDRLTHKSYMVNMNGVSYRMKETKEWLKKHKEVEDFITEEDDK